MIVDNHEKVAAFIAEEFDGDTFHYTELIDRAKRTGGSNRRRLVRTFFHRSRAHFFEHWPVIKALCDAAQVRAYTRLSPRSFKEVGKLFTTKIVDLAVHDQWLAMPYLYASCCGKVSPSKKLWLYDVDSPEMSPYQPLLHELVQRDVLVTTIPSRAGFHLIAKPHHITYDVMGVMVHKDNPTNLYVPEGAA
jgi:hypothetical protein